FALDQFGVTPEGRVCLDLGASTGGFCDVLLARGAAHVYAVDVGHGQLHPKIAGTRRVTNLEATDSRSLTRELITQAPSLLTADLSFIGLAKAAGAALDLAAPDADFITLIKPQFELGPKRLGKGGVVKDDSAVAEATQNIAEWLTQQGWRIVATDDSPILGGDGNREGLLHAQRGA
ncbi:MAG: SAM-dependent methyltransferase, partial [Caulobacterales bacterium]